MVAGGDRAGFDLTPTALRSLEPYREYLTIVSNTDVRNAEALNAPEIGGDHFRIERRVSHAGASEADAGLGRLRRRSRSIRSTRSARPGHADSVDAAVHREHRPGRRLRLRLLLRLHGHDQLGVADRAAADGSRSARRVRSAVRRRRARRKQRRAQRKRRPQHPRLGQRRSRATCRRQLGPADRARLGDYLDDMREIERRIQTVEARERERRAARAARRASRRARSFEEHVKLMFDLQAIAFASDITRVFSFKLGRDVSDRVYPEERRRRPAFHPASHHGDREDRITEFQKINTYHVSMMPYLLEKLKNTPDGDGITARPHA